MKMTFEKIHLCSEWIIYPGNPFLPGGLSLEPHFGDVFSEANGNDKSASSGIQNDASRVLNFQNYRKGVMRVDRVDGKYK